MAIRDSEINRFKKYEVAQHYTECSFYRIYDIFCTYRSRGGILNFREFAWIPIKKNPGKNLEDESGIWVKYIREYLSVHGI